MNKFKKGIVSGLAGILLAGASVLNPSSNLKAQELKPRCIINMYQHPTNPEWNASTSAEKKAYADSAHMNDNIWELGHTGKYEDSNWICQNYTSQAVIDYNRKGRFSELDSYDTSLFSKEINNRAHNIPCLSASVYNRGSPHSVNAIPLVNKQEDFTNKDSVMNHFNFFDNSNYFPIFDLKPGVQGTMDKDNVIGVGYTDYYTVEGWARGPQGFLKIYISEDESRPEGYRVDSLYIDSTYLVMRNPQFDKDAPVITSSTLDSKKFLSDISEANVNIADKDNYCFLDSAKFRVDSGDWNNIPCQKAHYGMIGRRPRDDPVYSLDTNIALPSSEGAHSVEVSAKDIQGNDTSKIWNFIIDKTKPEIGVSYPVGDSVYKHLKLPFEFTIDEEYLDRGNSYLEVNGNRRNLSDTSMLKMFSNNLWKDSTDLKDGENSFKIYAVDSAGNSEIYSDVIEVDTATSGTRVRNNFAEKCKIGNAYPNPLPVANEDLIIPYSTNKPEKVYAEIYNLEGKLEGHTSQESLPGKNELNINLPKEKGMYFIQITNSCGTETKKIIRE